MDSSPLSRLLQAADNQVATTTPLLTVTRWLRTAVVAVICLEVCAVLRNLRGLLVSRFLWPILLSIFVVLACSSVIGKIYIAALICWTMKYICSAICNIIQVRSESNLTILPVEFTEPRDTHSLFPFILQIAPFKKIVSASYSIFLRNPLKRLQIR